MIGAVGDIPALIAWWNVLLPAIGLSSPQAANGGGPKGQALQTDDGEQTIKLAIGPRRTTPTAAPPALRHEGQMFASFARIVKTANAHFDGRYCHADRAPQTLRLSSNPRNSGWSLGRHLARRA